MDEQTSEKIRDTVDKIRQIFKKEYENYIRKNYVDLLYRFPLIKGFNIDIGVLNDGIGIAIIFSKSDLSGFTNIRPHDLAIRDSNPLEYIKKKGNAILDEAQKYLNISDSYFSMLILAPFIVSDSDIIQLAHETAEGHYKLIKQEDSSKNEFFVAHEYSKEYVDDLRTAIEKALNKKGLKPYYADTEVREGKHILKEKIVPKIESAKFGIYDISEPNKPNVFIELGAAIGLKRPYYLIVKAGTEIPADLQGLDRIEYSSFKELTNKLETLIKIE